MSDSFGKDYPEREVDGVTYLDVCALNDMPGRCGRNFYFDEETQVAVFFTEGELYAVSNICPHQHAAVIADGPVEELTVTCPLHGWMYSLINGRALGGGAKLKTYKVFHEGGRVFLEKPRPVEPNWIMDF